MASSGSIVIQCQGNAMSSGIDVNRMPKAIVEIGAWQKTSTKSEERGAGDNCVLQTSFCFQLVNTNVPLTPQKGKTGS